MDWGIWESDGSPPRGLISASQSPKIRETGQDPISESKVVSNTPTHVLSETLNDLIYDEVRNKDLYRVGRFVTTGNEDSLGWVTIGKVLGKPDFMGFICSAAYSWISKECHISGHITADEICFVGLDCWGAALSSLLSAAFGSQSTCVAIRANGRYHTSGERIEDSVVELVARSKTVVLITDVVATGHSIDRFIESLFNAKPDIIQASQKWFVLTTILNNNLVNVKARVKFAGVLAACNRIKLPSIPSSHLPGVDLAPPTISFP